MRKTISLLLIFAMVTALCLTGCGLGGKDSSDGKKKTVGSIKVQVPKGWETDTAHTGTPSDNNSIFLKKDGLDTQYVWIRATDKNGVDAAMAASATDEIDDFETGKISWEGNKDLVWSEIKGQHFLVFVYGLEFKDSDVQKVMSSIKFAGQASGSEGETEPDVVDYGGTDDGDSDNGDSDDGDNSDNGGDDFDWSQYGIEDEPANENIDYKAKYDGTWYGYWSFGTCTGKFEKTTDTYFNCYCLIDMNDDGKGSFKLYNSWDEVGHGEFEATNDGRLICSSGEYLGAPVDDWIFYPCPGKDNMISVDDMITDVDGDVIEYAFYIRPWGQSWKDMEDSYVYRELIKDVEAKFDKGEDPPMGHANPTYYNP